MIAFSPTYPIQLCIKTSLFIQSFGNWFTYEFNHIQTQYSV